MLNNITLQELIWAKLEASGQFRRKNLTDKSILVNTTEILVAAIADSVVEHIWDKLEVLTNNMPGAGNHPGHTDTTNPNGYHVHGPGTIK